MMKNILLIPLLCFTFLSGCPDKPCVCGDDGSVKSDSISDVDKGGPKPDAPVVVVDASPVLDAPPKLDAPVVVKPDTAPKPDAPVPAPDTAPKPDLASTPDVGVDAGKTDAGGPTEPPTDAVALVKGKLHPHKDFSDETPVMVSFAVPLPPGVLFDDEKVLVKVSGQEVMTHTKGLGKWSFSPPKKMLCKNLPGDQTMGAYRSVLVQFPFTFKSTTPLDLEVFLGSEKTLATIPVATDIKSTWHKVKEGTFVGKNVSEPKVYTTFESKWLACSSTTSMLSPLPLDDSGETVTSEADPVVRKTEQGALDFFWTTINHEKANPKGIISSEFHNFLNNYEPWLYDRAQTFYNLYFRTGNVVHLREAHRALQYYVSKLYTRQQCQGKPEACVGFFSMKNDAINDSWKDAKYSYNESMVTHYWLSGDDSNSEMIRDVADAVLLDASYENVPTKKGTFYTERHAANSFIAQVFAFEFTGDPKYFARIKEGITNFTTHQNQPFPASSNNEINHCFCSNEYGNSPWFSPWKMSLLTNAVLRAYLVTSDARVPAIITNSAECLLKRGLYSHTYPSGDTLLLPREEASCHKSESQDGGPYSDVEHGVDVGLILSLAQYFSTDAAKKAEYLTAAKKLLLTHEDTLKDWTRGADWPGNKRALHRVNPPRKYAWWYKNAGSLQWLLKGKPSF